MMVEKPQEHHVSHLEYAKGVPCETNCKRLILPYRKADIAFYRTFS